MTKKLLNHIVAMQTQSSHYIEPKPDYPSFASDSVTWVEGQTPTHEDRTQAFTNDMIYMLDGPEQREAQAEAEAVANFIPDAMRTCSPGFHGDKVGLSQLIKALQDGINAANRLDRMKKALFYGRDYIENDTRPVAAKPAADDYADAVVSLIIPDEECDYRPFEQLFHAIIGNFTEAGEQLEAWLSAYLYGKDFDVVNMREEFGDNLWYLAIGMDAVEKISGEPCDFETEMRRVIAKLRERFPTKFTEDAANNRNLAAERAVLENGSEIVFDGYKSEPIIGHEKTSN